MSEQFLEILKFLFLALLYIFFIWVVIMSLIQLRKPKKSIRAPNKGNDKDNKTAITHLLTVEPQDTQGTEYALEEEIFNTKKGIIQSSPFIIGFGKIN